MKAHLRLYLIGLDDCLADADRAESIETSESCYRRIRDLWREDLGIDITAGKVAGYLVLGHDGRMRFRREAATARKIAARWTREARRLPDTEAGGEARVIAIRRDGGVSAEGEDADAEALRRAAEWLQDRSVAALIGYGLPREVSLRLARRT